MKIRDRRGKTLLTFQELSVGDVFYDGDGDILMKTSPIESDGRTFNAVGLNTNAIYDVSHNYEVVEVLNATLVIED